VIDLELEGEHLAVEVDTVEETHGEDLRVTLSAITGTRALRRTTDLGDDDVGDDVCTDRW
jgi:hypothetical protein